MKKKKREWRNEEEIYMKERLKEKNHRGRTKEKKTKKRGEWEKTKERKNGLEETH